MHTIKKKDTFEALQYAVHFGLYTYNSYNYNSQNFRILISICRFLAFTLFLVGNIRSKKLY